MTDERSGEEVHKTTFAKIINEGNSIDLSSFDRLKRVAILPRYSVSSGGGTLNNTAIQSAFVSITDEMTTDEGEEVMRSGDYGLMLISSKTDKKNRKGTQHMVVVKFEAFGENKQNVPQRFLHWPINQDYKIRVMIVPVEEHVKDGETIGFTPTKKSGAPLKDIPLELIVPITPDLQLHPVIDYTCDMIQSVTVELFEISPLNDAFESLCVLGQVTKLTKTVVPPIISKNEALYTVIPKERPIVCSLCVPSFVSEYIVLMIRQIIAANRRIRQSPKLQMPKLVSV